MSISNLTIEEDWFALDLESKLNKKIDVLQTVVNQQSEMIKLLSEEIRQLKSELHSTRHLSVSQNDRTHQLLEELKVLKQRELNIALREKIPIPFFPIPSSIFSKKAPLSPIQRSLNNKGIL
jgi:DNA gyrase/topoisomerase IV subunit A